MKNKLSSPHNPLRFLLSLGVLFACILTACTAAPPDLLAGHGLDAVVLLPALGLLIPSTKVKAFSDSIQIVAAEALQGEAERGLVGQFVFETNMTGANVTLGWLSALPGMRKLVDEPQKRDLRTNEITVKNYEWESTLSVPAIDIYRDKLGVYRPMAAQLGISAANHPLELVADLLVNGFSNADYTGNAFFHTSKKAWTGATAFGNKGAKKLSAANFGTAYANIRARKNAYGKAMRLGRQLILVVGPQDELLAKNIVEAERLTGDAGNNPYRGTAKVVMLPDLASVRGATGYEWFLLETGYPVKPLFLNNEIPLQILSDTRQDTTEFLETHTFNYQAYKSGNVGYALPELAYGSTGADAA